MMTFYSFFDFCVEKEERKQGEGKGWIIVAHALGENIELIIFRHHFLINNFLTIFALRIVKIYTKTKNEKKKNFSLY